VKRTLSSPISLASRLAGVLVALGSSACFLFPPGTPVDFCIEQAKIFCDLQFNCCSAAERRADPAGVFNGASTRRKAPSTVGECTDLVIDVCRASVEQQNESLVAERIRYDAEAATACLEDLRAAVDDCDATEFFEAGGSYLAQLLDNGQPGVLGSSCDNVIEANVDTDDECFASYECESGSCVVQNTGNDVSAEGECLGEGTPTNPFEDGIDFEICDGLEDNQPEG
jgi:hypothetical protein